jgi:hypothetical protein
MAARMTVYNDGRTAVLKGGFRSFNTSVPTSAKEWEQRKVELRKTLWRLLGDVPARYKQGKKEVLTKAFSELDFATGEELARKGYIVQCIDAYAFGERRFQGPAGSNEEGESTESSLFKTFLWEGRTLWGMMVRNAFQRHLYDCYGKESNFRGVLYPGVGHTYTRQMWKETLRWLKKHL